MPWGLNEMPAVGSLSTDPDTQQAPNKHEFPTLPLSLSAVGTPWAHLGCVSSTVHVIHPGGAMSFLKAGTELALPWALSKAILGLSHGLWGQPRASSSN